MEVLVTHEPAAPVGHDDSAAGELSEDWPELLGPLSPSPPGTVLFKPTVLFHYVCI